jgi:hypothetical protein
MKGKSALMLGMAKISPPLGALSAGYGQAHTLEF